MNLTDRYGVITAVQHEDVPTASIEFTSPYSGTYLVDVVNYGTDAAQVIFGVTEVTYPSSR